MAIPTRLIQVSCLLFTSALALLMAGCAGGLGVPSLSAPSTPTPTATIPHPATSLNLTLGSESGSMTPTDATVACSANDSTVVVRGSVDGALVTVRLSDLRKRQHIQVPPPVGGYSDQVTVSVPGASPSQALSYVVGRAGAVYQGVGTIDVSKGGNSGTLNVSAPSPIGQEPLAQWSAAVDGISFPSGGNSMSLGGTWECP
ncbi:MAG: hypothetical protein WB801_01565 [Candidatus Dormiibacterota bacterium]